MLLERLVRGRVASALMAAATFASLTSLTGGCCDCATPGAAMRVSARQAPLVASVTIGGQCMATVACGSSSSSPCTDFWIMPTREGTCQLAVTFNNGAPAFTREVEFRAGIGCCNGLYPVGDFYPVIVPDRGGEPDAGNVSVDAGEGG